MPTFTCDPAYPVPKRGVSIRFAVAEANADYVRIWCVSAPTGSKLNAEIEKTSLSRVQVFEGDADAAWTTGDFDKGGCYVLLAQEYKRGASSYGGDFDGDRNAAPSEQKYGSETTLNLFIGQKMTQLVGFGGDTSTLVLWVWDETIRPTSLGVHGEVSPAIVDGTTPRAQSVMRSEDVRLAVAALANVTAASAIGNLTAILADIRAKFTAHRTQGTVHSANDADNVVSAAYGREPTPQTMTQFASELLRKLRQHIQNDAGGASNLAGVNSRAYHTDDVDWTNLPVFQSGGGASQSYAAVADLWRAYEAHRLSETTSGGVHANPDTINALVSIDGTILNVHRHYLAALAALTPSIPATQSTAAVLLAAQAGFKES